MNKFCNLKRYEKKNLSASLSSESSKILLFIGAGAGGRLYFSYERVFFLNIGACELFVNDQLYLHMYVYIYIYNIGLAQYFYIYMFIYDCKDRQIFLIVLLQNYRLTLIIKNEKFLEESFCSIKISQSRTSLIYL